MSGGLPVEWLGPLCDKCGFRHEPSELCRHLLTSADLTELRRQWAAGIHPDKAAS